MASETTQAAQGDTAAAAQTGSAREAGRPAGCPSTQQQAAATTENQDRLVPRWGAAGEEDRREAYRRPCRRQGRTPERPPVLQLKLPEGVKADSPLVRRSPHRAGARPQARAGAEAGGQLREGRRGAERLAGEGGAAGLGSAPRGRSQGARAHPEIGGQNLEKAQGDAGASSTARPRGQRPRHELVKALETVGMGNSVLVARALAASAAAWPRIRSAGGAAARVGADTADEALRTDFPSMFNEDGSPKT